MSEGVEGLEAVEFGAAGGTSLEMRFDFGPMDFVNFSIDQSHQAITVTLTNRCQKSTLRVLHNSSSQI